SPDGGKLVFSSARALDGSDAVNTNGTQNIWVMNADSSSQTPLTRITANTAASSNPVWSPDGSKIAFASQRALNGNDAANTDKNIWLLTPDASSAAPLTKLTASGSDSQALIPGAWR